MGEFIASYLIVSIFIYFIPFLIALITGNRVSAVFLVNLLLGWTFIGWVWALVWAFTSERKPERIIINNTISNDRIINPVVTNPIQEESEYMMSVNMKKLSTNDRQLEYFKSHENKISHLKQLKQLFDSGILTQDEFNQQKSRILMS